MLPYPFLVTRRALHSNRCGLRDGSSLLSWEQLLPVVSWAVIAQDRALQVILLIKNSCSTGLAIGDHAHHGSLFSLFCQKILPCFCPLPFLCLCSQVQRLVLTPLNCPWKTPCPIEAVCLLLQAPHFPPRSPFTIGLHCSHSFLTTYCLAYTASLCSGHVGLGRQLDTRVCGTWYRVGLLKVLFAVRVSEFLRPAW